MTSRRDLLRAAAALPLLAGCAGSVTRDRRNYTPSGLPLRRVNVSPDRVVRVITGLRPYRPSGFVVETEKFDDKTVVHNYGHGGGGITLSWGTSQMAAELALATGHRRLAVIGCGAVGLASARLLQRAGCDVTIYARDLPPETTSNIAGGQWSPASLFDKDAIGPEFHGRLATAMRHSYREFQHLVGARYGIRWVSNYFLSDEPAEATDMRLRYPQFFPELMDLPPDAHPFPAPHALHFDTMFIEPPVYLPAVLRDFRMAGGELVVREFTDVADVMTLEQPVVVNCTGLGARALFGDEELMPVKGQLVVLKPEPDINYLMIHDGIYMFPRTDGVLLGGTFERDVWSLDPDPTETARILRRHRAFFDAMDDPWAFPWS
ncbi:MAG: FAD-dependent oxidoreductase [Woeseiaceae bacterium]|nr:FAD-dependent oxidoreductase [Woeseiaceae bacterium]